MSFLRNRVQLMGNLGNTPEIKNLKSGQKLAKFSLATNEFYTDKTGEKIQHTDWHAIIAWGKLAEIVENYLDKGREVIVVGKLTYNQYKTDTGEKRYFTQIQADEIQMLKK